MGGYVGSAIFGNLLLYIGLAKENWAKWVPVLLAPLFLFTAVWWFQSIFTSFILVLYGLVLFWLARNHLKKMAIIVLFVGSASVLYIVEDIGAGPQSDLAVFTELIPILPRIGWAVIWLLMVLAITTFTVKRAIQSNGRKHIE